MKIKVRGYSDDIIVVVDAETEADFGDGEYYLSDHGDSFLHFGDVNPDTGTGTVLKVEFDPENDGGSYAWLITRVKEGTATFQKATTGDPEYGKRDVATLEGDLQWVECWGSPDGPDEDDIEAFVDNLDPRDLAAEQAVQIMAIVRGNNDNGKGA